MKRILLAILLICGATPGFCFISYFTSDGTLVDLSRKPRDATHAVILYASPKQIPASAIRIGKLEGQMNIQTAQDYAARAGGDGIIVVNDELSLDDKMVLLSSGLYRGYTEYAVYKVKH